MKKICIIYFFIFLLFPCFPINYSFLNIQETKTEILSPTMAETTFKFEKSIFYAKFIDDYQTVNLRFQSENNDTNFTLNFDFYIEELCIIKVNETLYWILGDSLGFEQYFIWNQLTDTVYEPFFDMKNDVLINKIDYKNQILFGDTWNSDKGIMPDQTVELYLFSTAKQEHFKIAEKKGSVFNVKLFENCKIQYTDQNGTLKIYDYSEWIPTSVLYTASSFLIEGKNQYNPENLSSEKGLPWASSNGFGLDDTISITADNISNIIFMNGYISENKPYLYEQNSRVKNVLVINKAIGKSLTLNIKDEKNKQRFDISSICIPGMQTIDIVIKDIYPGTKYKDLCIQSILVE